MKKLNIKPLRFVGLFFAGLINSIGVGLFLIPFDLIDGGLSGTSYMLSCLLPLATSVFLLILNIPFYILAYKKIGIQMIIYSVFAIAVYSIFLFLIQDVFKLYQNQDNRIVNDIILATIFGGLLSGIGSGLTIRNGGALDGVEVLAVLFHKKLNITVGQFVMIYNAIIYITFGIIRGDFNIPLYSIIAYFVGLWVVDFINEGIDKTIISLIVTQKTKEMAQKIEKEMGRSMTIIDAHGYHSKKETNIIYCVVNRFEVNRLRDLIVSVDPQAFVTFNDVSGMIGKKIRKGKASFEVVPPKEEKKVETVKVETKPVVSKEVVKENKNV